MKRTLFALTTATIILCSGCSDRETDKVDNKDHVWKDQVKALDTAKEVDQLLQDSAAKQREDIDRQSE